MTEERAESVSNDRAIEAVVRARWPEPGATWPTPSESQREWAEGFVEALAGAGLQITDLNDPDLQLAKSEVHAIATAGVEDVEIIADFQDMARNAHQALTRYVQRFSGVTDA